MADIWTKAKRSDVMSRIKGAGNKDTELRLIKAEPKGSRIDS